MYTEKLNIEGRKDLIKISKKRQQINPRSHHKSPRFNISKETTDAAKKPGRKRKRRPKSPKKKKKSRNPDKEETGDTDESDEEADEEPPTKKRKSVCNILCFAC